MGTLQDLEQLIEELTDRGISLRLTRNGGLSVYPSAALNKNLRKRIKKRKRDIIELLRGAAAADAGSSGVQLLRCRACDGLIPYDAPYVSVEQDGARHYYRPEEAAAQLFAHSATCPVGHRPRH